MAVPSTAAPAGAPDKLAGVTPAADHVFHRAPGRPLAVAAEGSTIVTEDGRRVLDGAGGAIACSIGHGRPEIVAAMAAQAATLQYVHSTQFETPVLERFAHSVAELAPVTGRVFPVSGGSEANESAIKLARSYHLARGEDGRHVILGRSGAYHGNSRGALDASDRATVVDGYEPWLGLTVRVPLANPYRDDRTGEQHAAEIDRIIVETGPDRVAAMIAEPVSGATLGAVVPPPDYWPAVADVLRRHGVLLITDEVMTGFGRTGRWFGIDHWGVRPDIVTCGKGASSGYWPLGLCIASGDVHDAVDAAGNFHHGFTWSHHPVGAAVGEAVLAVMREEQLVERAAELGERCRSRLRDLLGDHPHVGEIRGIGLLNAVELVEDRETKQAFPGRRGVYAAVVAAAFERDLTVYPCNSCVDGYSGDAVLLGPPLSVSESTSTRWLTACRRRFTTCSPPERSDDCLIGAELDSGAEAADVVGGGVVGSSSASSASSSLNSWPSIGRLRSAPHGLELLQRLFELAPAGPHQLVELAIELLELGVHLVELLVVLLPLHAELADDRQDLVAGLLGDEVVVGLADDTQEGEQRQRRAHHHALGHGIVDQRRVVLVDETGELLVGEEQQHVVDRIASRLAGVVALRQLAHPRPHVAEEGAAVQLALGIGGRLEIAEVARHRELDVHVELVALGQREREVGAACGAVELGLLDVVDVLDEARQTQHVLGHPLAPLAASRG